MSEWLCIAEPSAELNHNSKEHWAQYMMLAVLQWQLLDGNMTERKNSVTETWDCTRCETSALAAFGRIFWKCVLQFKSSQMLCGQIVVGEVASDVAAHEHDSLHSSAVWCMMCLCALLFQHLNQWMQCEIVLKVITLHSVTMKGWRVAVESVLLHFNFGKASVEAKEKRKIRYILAAVITFDIVEVEVGNDYCKLTS